MMQNAALLWHVSLLVTPERKGLALGMVGLVRVVPVVVFSMISGVVADAWDRRRLMLFTQTAATLVALALASIAFSGVTGVWLIYVLAALGSAVGAFDLPALTADPIDDAARFLRDVLLVGDGAAADLRAGHPEGRRRRVRLALRGAGGRRGRHERDHGADDRAHPETRSDAALVGRRLWHRDRRVRTLAIVLADVFLSGNDRRHRYREHDHPQRDPSARDARSAARPHDRRQHGVLHGRPPARRARSRRRRELVRRDRLRRQRRHRMPDRNGMGRRVDAAAAPLSERRRRRRPGRAAGAGRRDRRCLDRLSASSPIRTDWCGRRSPVCSTECRGFFTRATSAAQRCCARSKRLRRSTPSSATSTTRTIPRWHGSAS